MIIIFLKIKKSNDINLNIKYYLIKNNKNNNKDEILKFND